MSNGKDGKQELFQKPWFATLNMMLAMAIVGLIDKMLRMRKTKLEAYSLPLLGGEIPAIAEKKIDDSASHRRKVLMVAYPAAFDILASALTSMGMLYIPASVWQMLRGSCIVFASLMSLACLKRKMYVFNFIGLLLCVAGVAIVGVAQLLGSSNGASQSSDSKNILLGITLVLCGQVVQASQLVCEEFLMKEVDLPPMQIVGWEGIWGTLMMFVIVYPVLWFIPGQDHGHGEDIVDTLAMIGNSHVLFALVVIYFFSCATFNATGIAVTANLSAVHRMMLDASRTILIWIFGLWVYYCYDSTSSFGESWTQYSPWQLVGFVVLVAGQAVYGEVLKLPGFDYPEPLERVPSPAAAVRIFSPLPREG